MIIVILCINIYFICNHIMLRHVMSTLVPPPQLVTSIEQNRKIIMCRAVQCSAVQCSAVQCSAVQCSAVQCSAVQCSAVQCSAVQ